MINFIKKIFDSPTLMSWSSVFVRFGSALFVLPLILKIYSPVEQSFWFFINTIAGFAMLADSGFGATLVRAVSYFSAGAEKIPSTRKEYDEKLEIKNEEPNLEKLRDLLTTSLRIYTILTGFLILMLSTVGILMVWNIMSLGHHRFDLWLAYAVIIPYCAVMISSVKWSSFMRGFGFISLEARFGVIQGSFQIIVFIILLSFGLKPVYLISYMMLQSLVRYFYLRWYVLRWFRNKGIFISNRRYFDKDIFRSLWGATWRLGGLSWGAYAISSGTSLVVSQLKDPLMMASFLFTMRIVGFIKGLARAPFYTNVPKIYSLAAKKDFKYLKVKSSEYIFLGMLVMIGGFGAIALFGNWGLSLIGIHTKFVPLTILLLIIITEFLDIHSSYHASIYTSTNHIPFLWPALISGALIIGLGFYVLPIYGILGLVLVKFLIQLSFNNWYSVSLSMKLLDWNFLRYLVNMPYIGFKGIINKLHFLSH
ncbi:MAG TPA: hypothetical protein VE870_08590, partial [Bacteroidales bacterium]|nr:hypothetical protein [Bacteroidales bacterium]